jgi:hypothetical protein
MANFYVYGLSNGANGTIIDTGTLIRGLSEIPGSVGAAASDLWANANRKKDWILDASNLYTFQEYVMADLFFELAKGYVQGKDSVSLGKIWDDHVNGIGIAHNAFSRRHRTGAMFGLDAAALWFAKKDPMLVVLLEHYMRGQGKQYMLKHGELRRMNTHIDFFNAAHNLSPALAPEVTRAQAGEEVFVSARVTGKNDALGNFPIDIQGTLKLSDGAPMGNPATPYGSIAYEVLDPPLMFEGTMVWSDTWDFDSKVAEHLGATNVSGRPTGGEMQVSLIALFADGVPFEAKSEATLVKQYSSLGPQY